MSRRSLRPFWPPCVPLSAQPCVTWSCSQPPHASCSCLISPGLGFPFSTSSSSILNFVVLLVLSKRSGNWRAVSGLFSKKLLNSIIFTNIRWENNFFNIFYWSFYKMKRNSYDRLRMVVMAGWFVGLVCFGFVLFFFFFLTLSFRLKHFPMLGGYPHKRVLVLAFRGGGPEQVNHNSAYVLCRLHPPLPPAFALGLLLLPLTLLISIVKLVLLEWFMFRGERKTPLSFCFNSSCK